MTKRRTVIIIGAGTAGLTCARELARRDLDVMVLESAPRIGRSVCGEYLCPAGVTTLSEIGIDHLVSDAAPIRGMRLVSPAGRVVLSSFPEGARHAAGLSFDKQVFLERLADEVAEAGGRVRFGWRVTEIEKIDDGWRVSGGAKRGAIECDVLVGADGRRSLVAEAAGLVIEPSARPRIAVRGFVDSFEVPDRRGEMHLLPGGAYIGVNPIRRDEVNLTLVCDADRVRAAGGAERALRTHAELSRDLFIRHDWSTLRDIRGVTPITFRVRSPVGDRAVLVGDASGFIDPLTGEGISVALWSGAAAGVELARGLSGADDLDACLRRYGAERAAKYWAKASVSRGFQWIIRRPRLCEWIGRFLGQSPARADAFIGVVGNNYTPTEGLLALSGLRPSIS